jgi:hypothetical protein
MSLQYKSKVRKAAAFDTLGLPEYPESDELSSYHTQAQTNLLRGHPNLAHRQLLSRCKRDTISNVFFGIRCFNWRTVRLHP